MSDTITIRGFVASEIKSSTTPGGVSTASFRLGSTDRRFDRASNTWVDGNTNWFTVQSFRQLAGHIGCSVKKGQRVIVVGKLKLRTWEHEGKFYHVAEIDAESVGHDLMWGSANFTRSTSSSSPQSPQSQGAQALSGAQVLGEQAPWPAAEDPSDVDHEGTPGEDTDGVLTEGADGSALFVDPGTGEVLESEDLEPAAA